ncbi:hypothetical protein HNQ50_000122 [Silvimonas terrae]|uniref:Uncharacterized protein n=1 Tax=Silvimonas terrae TaxID=300266 RepID=A0A840RAN9_9NEIS|nr:hypothetical protein [Silvimonas terrae]MBB5189412.1 hypothetical protein [Silvimonas terrae]
MRKCFECLAASVSVMNNCLVNVEVVAKDNAPDLWAVSWVCQHGVVSLTTEIAGDYKAAQDHAALLRRRRQRLQ